LSFILLVSKIVLWAYGQLPKVMWTVWQSSNHDLMVFVSIYTSGLWRATPFEEDVYKKKRFFYMWWGSFPSGISNYLIMMEWTANLKWWLKHVVSYLYTIVTKGMKLVERKRTTSQVTWLCWSYQTLLQPLKWRGYGTWSLHLGGQNQHKNKWNNWTTLQGFTTRRITYPRNIYLF
jgi:hypothetical protein